MTQDAASIDPLERDTTARTGDGPWPWVVAALFWLYYMTPFVQFLLLPDRPATPFLLHVPLWGLLAIVLLAFRERKPGGIAGACITLLLLSPAAVGAVFVAQEHYARRVGGRLSVAAFAVGALIAKVVTFVIMGLDGPVSALQVEFGVTAAGVVVATLIGLLRRSRAQASEQRAHAAQARHEAEQARLAEARLAERELIAREMHDAIANRLSLVALHAGALAYRTTLDPEQAREAARLIQTNAQASLDELRAMLTTLRSPDAAPAAPQPTLDQVTVLVADAADADQRVTLDVDGDLSLVPARVSRHAFRIVQEALTNARKHAPGSPVTVRLTHAGGVLNLRVTNPLADLAPADTSGSRLGLVGVAERVALLGGSVSHGVRGGRFVLEATLPITRTVPQELPA